MKSNMSKDLNELETLYEQTLNERFEDLDNDPGNSKEPFIKNSGPVVDGHEGTVVDPEDAKDDNAYEPKKFSQKSRKVVKDSINNFNMSKNSDNIFDKLFSSVMEGNYMYEDEPLDDDLDAGGEPDELDMEVGDLGGDVTITLTSDQVDVLKAILDQVDGDEDHGDEGDDEIGFEDDSDDDLMQEAPAHAELKAAPHGEELKGKSNKVKGKLSSAKGGSANTGSVKTNDQLQPAPDGVSTLTGKNNKVGHAKHIGD